MRILIDAHLSTVKLSGIGRYLNELVHALLEIDSKNEYLLLTSKGNSRTNPLQTLRSPNLRIKPVNLYGLSLRQHIIIPKIIRELQPDIYHHPHFDLPGFHRTPSVITVHDLKYIKQPSFFQGPARLKHHYMKLVMYRSLQKAQKVIAVSHNDKNDIESTFHISEDKISVIYHGVRSRHRRGVSSDDVARCLRKFKIDSKYLLFVGERRPHKNLVRLIEAFAIFNERARPKRKLVIVGKSYSRYAKPAEKVTELSLNGQVIFTEYVSDEELQLFYQNAEVFVFPSLYEGFGLPVLEAMMSGTPVIASNSTSLPEIVGDAGILVNPYSPAEIATALEKVTVDPKVSQQLIEKGLQRVRAFTWERTAQKTLKVYEEIHARSQ